MTELSERLASERADPQCHQVQFDYGTRLAHGRGERLGSSALRAIFGIPLVASTYASPWLAAGSGSSLASVTYLGLIYQSRWLCEAAMRMGAAGTTADSTRRVPAEWEPQEAIWLQWLSRWEKVGETAFARKSNVIVRYETLHILYVLYVSPRVWTRARKAIMHGGGDPDRPSPHRLARYPNDNSWMRDNGPVYVVVRDPLRGVRWPDGDSELDLRHLRRGLSAPISPTGSTARFRSRLRTLQDSP